MQCWNIECFNWPRSTPDCDIRSSDTLTSTYVDPRFVYTLGSLAASCHSHIVTIRTVIMTISMVIKKIAISHVRRLADSCISLFLTNATVSQLCWDLYIQLKINWINWIKPFPYFPDFIFCYFFLMLGCPLDSDASPSRDGVQGGKLSHSVVKLPESSVNNEKFN